MCVGLYLAGLVGLWRFDVCRGFDMWGSCVKVLYLTVFKWYAVCCWMFLVTCL